MASETKAPTPPSAASDLRGNKTSFAGRVWALAGLVGILSGLAYGSHLGYRTITDAWIAPLRLSPDNEMVVALRVQRLKEMGERARLESELAGIEAELKTVDLGIERLEALASGRGRALAWAATSAIDEARALREQAENLEGQKELLTGLFADQSRLLDRYKSDLAAGLVTAVEVERESAVVHQSEVTLRSNELQLSKLRSALAGLERLGQALSSGSTGRVRRSAKHAPMPPEVAKFDDDRIRIELDISRLQAEKRSALARQRAATANLAAMDALLRDLENRPLYRAMQADTDLAFVSYEHLQRLGLSDNVYLCAWSIFRCRTVGTVTEIVPGEVITQDPWGSLQRGQYVVLALRERSALYARVLRVRHDGSPGSLANNDVADIH